MYNQNLEKTLAVPILGNIPTSSDITTDEARNAALMVQRCLKQVREMELAYKDSDLQKVERILMSSTDFKYFEQAANLLLQTEMLSMGTNSSYYYYIDCICMYVWIRSMCIRWYVHSISIRMEFFYSDCKTIGYHQVFGIYVSMHVCAEE